MSVIGLLLRWTLGLLWRGTVVIGGAWVVASLVGPVAVSPVWVLVAVIVIYGLPNGEGR